MGVKSLVFLGLLISALFTYLCIDSKKDAFYASMNQEVPKVAKVTPTPVPIPEEVVAINEPSFAYVMGVKSKVAGLLATKDKDGKITKMIDDICGDDGCVRDIKYFDDTKEFNHSQEVLDLINFSIEKNVDKFAFYLDKNIVKVDGELQNASDKEEIDLKLQYFVDNKYDVTNNTHLKDEKPQPKEKNVVEALQESKPIKETIVNQSKIVTKEKNITTPPPKVKEPIKEEKPVEKVVVEAPKEVIKKPKPVKKEIKKPEPIKVEPVKEVVKPKKVVKVTHTIKEPTVVEDVTVDDVFVIPEHVSSEEASYRIGDLLAVEPIIFETEDGQIIEDSKSTLDKIADIILGLDGVSISVDGYSDGTGDATYNKVLSQRRADSVRNYLVKAGLRRSIIRSNGHGDISQYGDNSIEIKIKEGK